MQSTRQRILQYLAKNQQGTAPQLSQVLDLTQANIRYHLDVLEQAGKIEIVGETNSEGRGRPSSIYMLARLEQKNSLDILSSLLLQSLAQLPLKRQHAFLSDLAHRLVGATSSAGSITIRLSNATQHLNGFHYKAHWEAHADAPQIFFNQCPYAPIITQHPELCLMDQYILENLTGEKIEQIEKQARSPQGPTHCRFVIKSR